MQYLFFFLTAFHFETSLFLFHELDGGEELSGKDPVIQKLKMEKIKNKRSKGAQGLTVGPYRSTYSRIILFMKSLN
jgi:hypothetical protein